MTLFNANERRTIFTLSLIMLLRITGLFMLVPIFALYATQLTNATPFLIGLAIGIYALTQSILQIPFGILSDRFGRRPVIICGLLLFTLGGLVAAATTSIYGVIIGRILQGSGAIGGSITALISDATQETNRTMAMAIYGVAIGVAFVIAILIGPLLTHFLSLSGFFLLAAVFGMIGVLLFATLVPKPQTATQTTHQPSDIKQIFSLVKNSQFMRLNCGIFVLQNLLVATFVALPITLINCDHWQRDNLWQIYVPTIIPAMLLAFAVIAYIEKKRLIKSCFLGSLLSLIIAESILWLLPSNLALILLAIIMFFTAFVILEALLPALVSGVVPSNLKGTALGGFYCCQFLGAFFGGLIGGFFSQHSVSVIYQLCVLMALFWLAISRKIIFAK
jgi:MFS family permease